MVDENQLKDEAQALPAVIPWPEFLESYPLNTRQLVSEYYKQKITVSGDSAGFIRLAPILRLYCPKCEGFRNFAGRWQREPEFNHYHQVWDFLLYKCKDCEVGHRTFCVLSNATKQMGIGYAVKIGEYPEVHVELPQSLQALLGDDYSLFVKGLICEKQGLGIGAFTYYRRVVESHKSQLVAQILQVAQKLCAPKEMLETLGRAAKERQFSRAVDAVRDAIPQALLVDSHNPLKLLHDALSIGMHAETDENCLKIAHGIRMVLADFSERLKLALEDQAELRSAVAEMFKFIGEAKKKANT